MMLTLLKSILPSLLQGQLVVRPRQGSRRFEGPVDRFKTAKREKIIFGAQCLFFAEIKIFSFCSRIVDFLFLVCHLAGLTTCTCLLVSVKQEKVRVFCYSNKKLTRLQQYNFSIFGRHQTEFVRCQLITRQKLLPKYMSYFRFLQIKFLRTVLQ